MLRNIVKHGKDCEKRDIIETNGKHVKYVRYAIRSLLKSESD